jgi:hypothetical protein
MSPETTARPQWEIDRILEGLTGRNVRALARAFSPPHNANGSTPKLIDTRSLFLPDNSQPDALPVFFEGKLLGFERCIGVVQLRLGPPELVESAGDGMVPFRGTAAIIVRGPALVDLAFPFHVEPIPETPDNYWRDLHVPLAQLELSLPLSKAASEG